MADVHIHLPMSAGAHPNQDAPAAHSGLAGIRRTAARNVYSIDASDGNRQAVKDAPPAKPNVASKTAKPPVKSQTVGRNKQPLEKRPPFAQEPIERANEQARQLHRKGR